MIFRYLYLLNFVISAFVLRKKVDLFAKVPFCYPSAFTTTYFFLSSFTMYLDMHLLAPPTSSQDLNVDRFRSTFGLIGGMCLFGWKMQFALEQWPGSILRYFDIIYCEYLDQYLHSFIQNIIWYIKKRMCCILPNHIQVVQFYAKKSISISINFWSLIYRLPHSWKFHQW